VVEVEASKWADYFYHIRKVCPWSYSAWTKGLIDIVDWQGDWQQLDGYEARIYRTNLNRRRLKKLCARLDTSDEYEWLWSEPRYGPYAAPMSILIQQDRQRLEMLRLNLKSTDNVAKY
jgi:hypothetical protein